MTPLPPFPAHNGEGAFVFVSYAHRDAAVVFPVIEAWHRAGLAIWYDEGIEPGQEWPEAIGRAIAGSIHFIVFISRASVASVHVRNEIGLASDVGKPLLAIHLEEIELPYGLRLRLNETQAIFRYKQDATILDDRVMRFVYGHVDSHAVPPEGRSQSGPRSRLKRC